jgi:hypothetical protein
MSQINNVCMKIVEGQVKIKDLILIWL